MNWKEFFNEWFSFHWLHKDTLISFDWVHPEYFYLIPVLIGLLLFKWFFYHFFRGKLLVGLDRRKFSGGWAVWLRFLPDFIFLISLSLIVVALARPQRTNESIERYTDGIDIMLTLDISESMKIEDFKPDRLTVAKKVATDFILGRFEDRIGLVIFSGDAFSLCPLTTDYDLLTGYIKELNTSAITKPGTAIGSALAVSTNRMRETTAKSKVMLLLSDGDNNAGSIDPITAAKLAKAYDIKIYTILVGKSGKVPMGKDFFGNTQYVENTIDESALRNIAEIGGGKFYRVTNSNALKSVFQEIDRLEKSEIKENRYRDTKDYYVYYLFWGVLFWLIWLLLKSTMINNFIED